jgi:hypothetical protein
MKKWSCGGVWTPTTSDFHVQKQGEFQKVVHGAAQLIWCVFCGAGQKVGAGEQLAFKRRQALAGRAGRPSRTGAIIGPGYGRRWSKDKQRENILGLSVATLWPDRWPGKLGRPCRTGGRHMLTCEIWSNDFTCVARTSTRDARFGRSFSLGKARMQLTWTARRVPTR